VRIRARPLEAGRGGLERVADGERAAHLPLPADEYDGMALLLSAAGSLVQLIIRRGSLFG
jgi:hypothetical protein